MSFGIHRRTSDSQTDVPPRRSGMRRLLAVATVAIGCLAPASLSSAQFGGSVGFDKDFQPDFLQRDITTFIQTLNLEEWQRPIVETLLDDYRLSFDAGMADMRQRMLDTKGEISSSSSPEEVLKKIMGPIDEWAKKKAQLRDEFNENVRSQLSDQQKELWPNLERALRREKSLAGGELQGESVDLLLIVRELQLAPQGLEFIKPVLTQYELELDTALLAREERMRSQKDKIKEAMQNKDDEEGLRLTELVMATRVALRDVQDANRDNIRDAIRKSVGDDPAGEFERIALERGYPKVYRVDPVLPLFDTARAVSDLTDEQRGRLDSLEAQYHNELPVVNKDLADAYRREEPKEPRRRQEQVAARLAGEKKPRRNIEPEAIATARKVREDFWDRYRKAIMDILNDDQKTQMPVYAKERPPADERAAAEEQRRLKEAESRDQQRQARSNQQVPGLSTSSPPNPRGAKDKSKSPAFKLKPDAGGGGRDGGPARSAE